VAGAQPLRKEIANGLLDQRLAGRTRGMAGGKGGVRNVSLLPAALVALPCR
jgi:hypothetical protein